MDLNIFYFYPFLYYNLSNLEEIIIFWRLINRRLDNLPLFQGEKHAQDIANGFNPFADNPELGHLNSLRKKDGDCQKGTDD